MFDNLTNPVLLWSSGKDSTLLLAMLIESGQPFDIVQFGREFWTREQKKRADEIIKKYSLKVFSYPPSAASIIGDDGQLAFVEQYAINGAIIPLVRDILPTGTRCLADLDSRKVQASPFLWTDVVIGSRQDDKHFAFPDQVIPSEKWTVNNVTVHAPLFSWTRQMIKDALKDRGLAFSEVPDEQDTGNLVGFCTKCLHGVETFCPKEGEVIPPVTWNPQLNLQAFRDAYGVVNAVSVDHPYSNRA